MINKILFSTLLLLGTSMMWSQSGITPHAGISVSTNGESEITQSGQAHYGYFLGVDVRMFADTKMFFTGGVQYHRISLLSQSSPNFFSNDANLSLIKGRWGLGFYLATINNNRLRLKILGSLDYVNDFDSEAIVNNAPYNQLNDSSLGAVVGLGIDLKFITLDIEYQKGFINTYREIPDSKVDYITLSAGVFF